ncbi:acyl carrier protein [Pseudomonas aeruginosa]|nr:acyl carrier protein [Pseudomonas aeruginosa]
MHDDFYALGGDSILMLRIRAAAQRRGLGFELADLMRNPTVAGLAERLVRPSRGAKLPAVRTGFRSRQAAPGRAGGRLPDQPAESRPALP